MFSTILKHYQLSQTGIQNYFERKDLLLNKM